MRSSPEGDGQNTNDSPGSTHLATLARLVTDDLRAAPAAVIAAAVLQGKTWLSARAAAGSLPESPADTATIFDLASITKSFTALTAARLARLGTLSLATPLGQVVSEARGTASESIPLKLFLAHRAGLDAHRPLFAPLLLGKAGDRSEAFTIAASARRDDCLGPPPREGFAPVYSDLGYLLVGEAIQRTLDEPLSAVISREVGDYVGSHAMSAREIEARGEQERVAPTEHVEFRGGVVRGVVHDENAWAIGGSEVSGHAGLFGTADDVLALGVALIEASLGRREDWLRPSDLTALLRVREGGTLRAGFDGKSSGASSAGARFGPRTFGHLGFTGTSIWIDPDASLVGVLLTNRVHPTRENDAIRRARPLVYDGIFGWSEAIDGAANSDDDAAHR